MKNGDFVIYKDKEFEFYMKMDKTIKVVSRDSADLSLGFTIVRPGTYVKVLNVNEVKEIYSIRTYGIYKGHSVAIRAEDNNKYHIESGGSENIFVVLGFQIVERGVYRKWINKNELEKEWEEKNTINW